MVRKSEKSALISTCFLKRGLVAMISNVVRPFPIPKAYKILTCIVRKSQIRCSRAPQSWETNNMIYLGTKPVNTTS